MSFLPDRKSFVGASRHSVSRQDDAGGAPEKTISPGLFEIGKNVFLRVGQDNLSLIAAGVAFYAMTAIFPAIAALVSVYGLFADPHTIERLIASYADLLPANSLKLLTDALENFAGNSHSTLNAALVISVALALWSAKAGVSSLMTGLNIANETAEKRSFIVQQIVALALTIGAAILAIVALASVALIPAILGFLPLTEGVKTVLGLARWPLLAILVYLGLAVAYRLGPSTEHPAWKWVTWGAAIATGLWLAASALFSFYVSHFGAYDATYGALAAPVILLLWFWLSALAVLVGAAIDAELECAGGVRAGPMPAGAAASGKVQERNAALARSPGGNRIHQEGWNMARSGERSLSDLQHEAARSRAEFSETVDQLRSKVADTVTDFRARVSPDAIKAEASDYFRAKADDLVDKARRNPLQAAAIGLGVGYPLLRVVRSIPAPVLMVGAGLYLLGSSSAQNASLKFGQSASRKLGAVADQLSEQVGAGADVVRQNVQTVQDLASDGLTSAREAASSGLGNFKDQTSTAGATLADGLNQAKDRAADFANSASDGMGDIKRKAAGAFSTTSDAVRGHVATTSSALLETAGGVAEFGADAAYKIRDRAVDTSQRATSIINQTIQQNPLLVGGLGLAAGMLIASALPQSDTEKSALARAGVAARRQANDLASKGFDAAKGIAVGVMADVAEQAVREGLSGTDLNVAAEDLGRRVRKVADSATGAAFGAAKTNDAA